MPSRSRKGPRDPARETGRPGPPRVKLTFLGGATTVTGSQFLVSTDRARVIVDCGLFQGSPSEVERNRVPLSYDPATIDAFLLTHAHLDHCGLLPVVVDAGYRGPVYATQATAELARLVLLDSGKVQVEQARNREERAARLARRGRTDPRDESPDPETALRQQPPRLETTPEAPLYGVPEAEAAIERLVGVDYGQTFEPAPGFRATLHDAGHILGSAIVVLDVTEGSETRRIVFSGDLGRPNTPILRDPTAITGGADYVVMESTYGGREHEPGEEAVRLLGEAVTATASS